jgi:hypothetical protein
MLIEDHGRRAPVWSEPSGEARLPVGTSQERPPARRFLLRRGTQRSSRIRRRNAALDAARESLSAASVSPRTGGMRTSPRVDHSRKDLSHV